MTQLDDGADLRAVMERSVRDLDAPDRCGPAAVATGRRLRTRRRLAVTLTGAAAVALVAAVALPALGGSEDATPEAPMASDTTPTPAPTPTDPMTPSPGPNEVPSHGSEAPAGWWDVPSTEMLGVLEATLPGGVTVQSADTTLEGVQVSPSPGDGGPGQDPEAIGSLHGVLSGPTGPGAFQILLYPPDQADLADVETTTDADGNQASRATASSPPLASRIRCRAYHDTCEPIVDADGGRIGKVSTTTERGTLLYEATLLGPDGGALNLTVMNSSGEKPGYEQPSAEVPPLTTDQLRALAEDPVWTSYRP